MRRLHSVPTGPDTESVAAGDLDDRERQLLRWLSYLDADGHGPIEARINAARLQRELGGGGVAGPG
ncbi:MAG: hypothetical protein M0P31_17800 [Solirubrobacteraceae bacterium]|nr:hypothetical protein [Solirubrobacteraceae bacterium]